MTKRWIQRPPGSNWGDWGEDDELGRVNLLTPSKVMDGIREVCEGITFSLSLPLDLPGGNALNPRRYPPILRPTEDVDHNQEVFYNVIAKEAIDPTYIDVWSDDVVTMWLQYSTQWDSLAHQGAMFDVEGHGVEEPVYYNGFKAGVDIIGPQEDAKNDGSGSTCFSRHLGLEHMAAHGVQGRGVLVDLSHLGSDWQPVSFEMLQDVMAKDKVVVEPGDMLIVHTGYATQILGWDRHPDPTKVPEMYPYLDGEDESLLKWIAESNISALISDNFAVEGWPAANPAPHTYLGIHHLCLFKLGIPLGELWYTEELATWLRDHDRNRFLLTAPPLRLPGAIGGPLTPIATV